MTNTRPKLSREDRELMAFVLNAMRDDRNRTTMFKDDNRYDKAEELFRRLIPDCYELPVPSSR